jgi:hypothetical protein
LSEYIEIETEIDDEANRVSVSTNLVLSGMGEEIYPSIKEMEEGSALAQSLSQIEGMLTLTIEGREMAATHDQAIPSHIIASEISSALKDFFL